MTVAYVNSGTQTGAAAINYSGAVAGNTLVVIGNYHNYGGGFTYPTVTDSSTQTWSTANVPTYVLENGQAVGTFCYYLPNCNSGTHNLTINGDGAGYGIYGLAIIEVSGLPTSSSLDKTNSTNSTTANITTLSSGSTGTLSAASELVIAGITVYDVSEATAGISTPAGFTQLLAINSGSTSQICQYSYQITAATTALNPNWTWTQTAETAAQAQIVTFGNFSQPSTATIAWIT
jgi:hypothetical protein